MFPPVAIYSSWDGATVAKLRHGHKMKALWRTLQTTQRRAHRAVARDKAYVRMEDVLNTVNSVRGNPAFGENSALYASFGYKRKADYSSGLTRKSDQPEPIQVLKAA